MIQKKIKVESNKHGIQLTKSNDPIQ